MYQFLTKEALHQKSPEEITALLYEACCSNLESAIANIEEKEYMAANESLKKANDIIHRLGAGINYEAGIIADQLETIYNYMADKIIEANYTKNTKLIQEVLTIVTELMSSWNQAMKTKTDLLTKQGKMKANAYERNVRFE
ncbi:flagellar export chaperone FliS [Bacillus alkalicellulosilyticus]|uniref:flagellar export chaperone FliS n=1 Tax=Alkalihalobacterium alkalicellulosilyticum TaxID=1912214 RepID=UPI00099731CE|nr:flagellar export chaperone FliS [Bacillus alkalicellulosilyticus]